jgi:hypothetical protein
MIRERVLTISTLMALTGTAYAGPGITDKSYWPNEVGPASYRGSMPTETDRYRARAMHGGRGAPATQAAPEAKKGQYGCRYLGGPKYPITC